MTRDLRTAAPGELTCPNPTLTAALAVVDALVFRRVGTNTWAHLGGYGRGRGWAGVVKIDAALDPLAVAIPAEAGGVARYAHHASERVLGPYYARAGALVRVSGDVLVVLGNPTELLAPDATDVQLHRLATDLDALVQQVSPAKHLADELEMLHAVRAVTSRVAPDLAATLAHVVEVAVQSLSCEVGLARTGDGHLAVTSSWAAIAADDPALVGAAQTLLERAADGATCVQDSDVATLPAPLDREHGVRSLLALALPPPVGGVLVVAHTSADPRGFTGLCRDLGRQLADAAGVVLHTASLREELTATAAEHALTARRDPLTGLGNRLAFDEALVEAQGRVDAGQSVTVLTLDVDGLKHVNDTAGHDAGDQLLRRCADVLRLHGRTDDVCVRLGGDEFAVLMPHAGVMATHRLDTLAAELGGVTSDADTVAASVGMATAHPRTSVADAVREADAAMYAAKRARRAAR
ncbi:MAG: sensor domain-containing diguanylate cyclase [Mycobacteriaceae bacterium]